MPLAPQPPQEPSPPRRRLVVAASCAPRCFACVACPSEGRPRSLEEALAHLGEPEITLGGGDVTRWPPLASYLAHAARRDPPQKVWIEAPARAFTAPVIEALARRGAHGLTIFIEGAGAAVLQAMRAGDGEAVIAKAEALGLQTTVRLGARPKTLPLLAALAERIAPRRTTIEILPNDAGRAEGEIPIRPLERLLLTTKTVTFSGERMGDRGYLPPCIIPSVWRERPSVWSSVHWPREAPNRLLSACEACTLQSTCQFADLGALSAEARAAAEPITRETVSTKSRPRSRAMPVPDSIVKKRPAQEVICVTPWTTLEIVDPDGKARQCCSTWTIGDRGTVGSEGLTGVWNGPGYREARRLMGSGRLDALCNPICSRLYDHKFSEPKLRLVNGAPRFVDNQLLLAEDIAERREVTRARPTQISLCPSTYCNYDCIMCDHGRTPRRELPDAIWDELTDFMPTVERLTLMGGEPLANPLAQRFLRDFDASKWPDALVDMVTNGSLLTEAMLSRMKRCSLGGVTVSLNAGTPEVYEAVQRGLSLDRVLDNLGALIRYRDAHPRWFGISLSFVVQPAASHTLLQFAEIARSRGLRIRLMALNPQGHEGLDFYADPDVVERVVADVDRLAEYATKLAPDWLPEVLAARGAVLGEAEKRAAQRDRGMRRRLPVLG